jgi:hypothetical protein
VPPSQPRIQTRVERGLLSGDAGAAREHGYDCSPWHDGQQAVADESQCHVSPGVGGLEQPGAT